MNLSDYRKAWLDVCDSSDIDNAEAIKAATYIYRLELILAAELGYSFTEDSEGTK